MEKEAAAEHAASQQRVALMRNLTLELCQIASRPRSDAENGESDHTTSQAASTLRVRASMHWATLNDTEAATGCVDCVTRVHMNCTMWFAFHHRIGNDYTHRLGNMRRRKLQEQLRETEAERKRAIEDGLGAACCRTNMKTGVKECGAQFCSAALGAKMRPRAAHILRRMHEGPSPVTLNVAQLVATDMLAPHLHEEDSCRSHSGRKRKGELECVASSMATHLAQKHGFSTKELNAQLDRYGLSISQVLTAQLRHSTTPASGRTSKRKSAPSYASRPEKAEQAASRRRKLKEEQDQTAQSDSNGVGKMHPLPHMSWVPRSVQQSADQDSHASPNRRRAQADELVRTSVSALGASVLQRRGTSNEWLLNQSLAAKKMLRLANVGAARTSAPPVTTEAIMTSAADVVTNNAGSLVGRLRASFGHMQTVVLNSAQIYDKVASSLETTQMHAKKSEREKRENARRLSSQNSQIDAVLQQVDSAVSSRLKQGEDGGATEGAAGFRVPDEYMTAYGWIAESFDWGWAHEEATRVGRILYEREEALLRHADATGTLPAGDLPERLHTGYAWLDVNAPPSILGDALRSLVPAPKRHRRLQHVRSSGLQQLPRDSAVSDSQPTVIGVPRGCALQRCGSHSGCARRLAAHKRTSQPFSTTLQCSRGGCATCCKDDSVLCRKGVRTGDVQAAVGNTSG